MHRALILLLALGASLAAVADEGMWTFDNFPADAVRERYGARLDQPWLDRVRRATVRLESGCTGSFVSARGLVLTNQHCIVECMEQLSRPERDVLGGGFVAASQAAEERCAASQASVLTRMQDVTAAVRAEVGEGGDAQSNERRRAMLTRLEQECEASYAGQRGRYACEAITLYGGGQYFLYHYRRYDDVRLVFVPEQDVAGFGGDLDNFEFPRWNLDAALLRVYDNGRPAATPDFLRWRRGGAAEGEAVFVAGHPGSTQRLSTLAQLRFQRDPVLTQWLPRAAELRGRYLQFATLGEEQARTVQAQLFMLENVLKVRRRHLRVLLDEDFLARREDEERRLREALQADEKLQGYDAAFGDVERALAAWRLFYDRYMFLEAGAALQGDLATAARVLVRVAMERDKPNEQRQRGYTDSALPLLRQELLAPQPVYADLEALRLAFSLDKFTEYLGVDDPLVQAALGRRSPGGLAARLVRATKLGEPAYRERLWEGGREAVEAADDALLALALRLEPAAQQARRRYEDEVEAVLAGAGERIARARFAVYGSKVYPDATFTLRLSFGAVRGWREGEREVRPFTTLDGLFARASGQAPFRLPPRWLEAQERVNLDTPFNFATDNDITGGNSGSPVLDARGRLVGLIFDGNIHSIGGDFWFDPALNRAVAVHPAAIVLALGEIYGAGHLLRELSIE